MHAHAHIRTNTRTPSFLLSRQQLRLLTLCTGCAEKIFQRQANKQGLSHAVVDEGGLDVGRGMALEELRDLFSFAAHTSSDTHDKIACTCLSDTHMELESAPPLRKQLGTLGMHQLSKWTHLSHVEAAPDAVLVAIAERKLPAADTVSFLFVNASGVRRVDEVEAPDEDADMRSNDGELPAAAAPPGIDDEEELLELEED